MTNISLRSLVKSALIEKLGYFNFVNETNGKFRVSKNGSVSYYAYGETRHTDIDSLLDC
jgi:hypothetical protein